MRAYQVVTFGAPLVRRNLPDPSLDPRAVIVEVESCGLCHSDVHFHEGHIGLGGGQTLPVTKIGINPPATLGHEICGRVATFGPSSGLRPADVGRPVIVYPWIGCGRCQACLAGRDNECPKPENLGLQRPGGHGEKVVVRDVKFLIPADGLDLHYAGIFACCGLSAYAALRKIVRPDGPIGVIGLGGLGLMALSIAKGMKLGPIAAMDRNDAKLTLARQFYGSDFIFDSRATDVAEQIRAQTGGLIGVVDFVGAQQTCDLAVSVLRIGGTYVNVGLFGGALNVPLALLVQRQLVLRGSYTGTPAELSDLVALARDGRIKPIPIRNASMDTINEGLGQLRTGQVTGRIVHVHNQEMAE